MRDIALQLDKSVSNNIEEKGPAFGDAPCRNKATGVDIDDSSRDDADGGDANNMSLLSKTVLSWTIQDILLDNEVHIYLCILNERSFLSLEFSSCIVPYFAHFLLNNTNVASSS